MRTAARAFRLGALPPRQRLQTRLGTLECVVSGTGSPTIVLLNGAGMALESWRALYPAIEKLGTVFAWDRFGIGGSDPPLVPQTGGVVVSCLSSLLGYTGLPGPYVLVGHSLGGLHANLFARLHPRHVAGVLFVEATHPRDHDVLEQHESQLSRSLSKVFALPQRLFRPNLHEEIEWLPETIDEIAGAGSFPDVPVGVVTGGTPAPQWLMSEEASRARLAHQRALVRLSARGEHVIAKNSGHFPQLSEPEVVLDALRRVIERARAPAIPIP